MLGPLGAAVGQGAAAATNPTHHAHCALRIPGILHSGPSRYSRSSAVLVALGATGAEEG